MLYTACALGLLCCASLPTALAQLSEPCAEPLPGCRGSYPGKDGITYYYDLNQLCNPEADYFIQDAGGHNYTFNICGTAQKQCNPQGYPVYQNQGAAIQSWGAVPPCSNPPTNCENAYTGNPVCCTAQCVVLGMPTPIMQLENVFNPQRGGIKFIHRIVTPIKGDPYGCDNGRQLFYHIACDTTAAVLQIKSVDTVDQCNYHIYMAHASACGCAPQCENKKCGYDGCQGVCGTCDAGSKCMADGSCCLPDCTNSNCGSDGCGGSCGACPATYQCEEKICTKAVRTSSDAGAIGGAFVGGAATVLVILGGYIIFSRRKGRSAFKRAEASDTYGSLS